MYIFKISMTIAAVTLADWELSSIISAIIALVAAYNSC